MSSSYFPGRNPLNYQGTSVTQPPQQYFMDRTPTELDWEIYNVGDEWLDKSQSPAVWFKLCSKARQAAPANPAERAVWLPITAHHESDFSSLTVDTSSGAGTNPVLPDSSETITITGAQVASSAIGANVVRTNSLAASSLTVQVQQSGEAAAQDTTLNGVCHFDSTHFNVTSGFVQLSGGGMAVDSFTPDTGTSPVVPSGTGDVTIRGQATPNVSGIQVTGGLNSLALAMFSPFKGDFTFTDSVAGNSEILTVSHSDNTAANNGAALVVSVAGTTQTGDPYLQWSVGSARSYALGPDTNASQTLKLTTTNAATVTPSSGTEIMTITSAGYRNLPLQPCLEAYLAVSVPNATGNAVVYTVIMDTELFNQNPGSFVAGIYTVPATGKYLIAWSCGYNNLAAANTEALTLIAIDGVNISAGNTLNAGTARDFANGLRISHTDFFSLTAGQTVSFKTRVSGGAQTVGIEATDVTAGVRSTYACITMLF